MEVVQRRKNASSDARSVVTDGKTAGRKNFAHGPLMSFQFMNNVIITLLIETYYFWQRKQLLTFLACTTLSLKRPTAVNESTSTQPHFLAGKLQYRLMNAEAHSEYVSQVIGLSAWIAKYSINVPVPSAFLAPSVSVRRIKQIGSGCAPSKHIHFRPHLVSISTQPHHCPCILLHQFLH
jgi:hypothetical protein